MPLNTTGKAYVKHYRYSHLDNTYILQRTIITTDERIAEELEYYLQEGDTFLFNKFECFNSEGKIRGSIYTSHIYLFEHDYSRKTHTKDSNL